MEKRGDYLLRFYLAHPFDSRYRMRSWELRVEEELGIEIMNPFFDSPRPDQEIIDNLENTLSALTSREDRYGLTDEETKDLVFRDLYLISSCVGLIAIIDGSLSYGTIQEMVYATLYRIPVFALVTNGHSGHPWLRYHSTKIFEDLNQLEYHLGGYVQDIMRSVEN